MEDDPQYVKLHDCDTRMTSVDVALAKINTTMEMNSKSTDRLIKVLGIVVTIISIAAAILTRVL